MDHKVTVVGAGHVGATTAQRIAEADLADVVLVDILGDLATGKALDMMESAPVLGFSSRISGQRFSTSDRLMAAFKAVSTLANLPLHATRSCV